MWWWLWLSPVWIYGSKIQTNDLICCLLLIICLLHVIPFCSFWSIFYTFLFWCLENQEGYKGGSWNWDNWCLNGWVATGLYCCTHFKFVTLFEIKSSIFICLLILVYPEASWMVRLLICIRMFRVLRILNLCPANQRRRSRWACSNSWL